MVHGGFNVRPVGAAVPHWQTVPMRASFLEALCLDLRNERHTGMSQLFCFVASIGRTFRRHGTSVMDTSTHDCEPDAIPS